MSRKFFNSKRFCILASDMELWNELGHEDNFEEHFKKMKINTENKLEDYFAYLKNKFREIKSFLNMGKEKEVIFYWKDGGSGLSPLFSKKELHNKHRFANLNFEQDQSLASIYEDIKNEPNGFYRLYFCIGWEITERSINKNLHNSLDDFLMDLSLKKNDLYFLKSQVGDISKLTEYGTEIYFRNRKDTYYYAAYDSEGYLEEEWEEEFSY